MARKHKQRDNPIDQPVNAVRRDAKSSQPFTQFWEKYKHPKWQEKRLRIMERAGFMCELCQDDETTLNVHHTYYDKGADPWEYPDESLRCLCETCHKETERVKREIVELIGVLPDGYQYFVLGLCRGVSMLLCKDNHFPVECGEVATGMALAFLIEGGGADAATVKINKAAIGTETISGHVVKAALREASA